MEEKQENTDTNIGKSESNGWIRMTWMYLLSGKIGFIVDISNSLEPIVGTMKKKMEDIFVGTTPQEKLLNVTDHLETYRKKYCPSWTLQTIEKLYYGTTPEGKLEKVSCVGRYTNAESVIIVRPTSHRSKK